MHYTTCLEKKWVSALEQKRTYYQIYLDRKSQPLITFITLLGLYEWVKVLLSLTNAPTFNKAEQKYHSRELELLGLKWVATGQHFGDYLVYDPLGDVYTDNNPWVYFF